MDSQDQIRALEKRIESLEQAAELPKLMTPTQVAEFVGISETQFYAWKRAGDVPPAIYWSERTVRYDRDDVMAWANAHKVGEAG